MKTALVTGSAGLIGSESVRFLIKEGFKVIGIDNNMRKYFFGADADTDWNRKLLENEFKDYIHYNCDIRDEKLIAEIFNNHKFNLIIHAAAQPSHDWAAKEPLTDFSVNATGTLILLEAFKKYCPEAVFIFTSTNKVYGDLPNNLPLVELDTRFEIDSKHKYVNGIDESMPIDQSKHSIFGASKVAADIMVQEYGRYFNLRTGVFRGGCLTGPAHSGTQLHGFLAYLIKCIAKGLPYTIFGYKGKQVRDNIHSYDLVKSFYEFYKNPRCGEVYNMGGSRFSNISMMEAIEKIESALGRKGNINYSEKNREGDHIWYVSDVSKFKKHYPKWKYDYNADAIIEEICRMGHFSKPTVGRLVVSELAVKDRKKIFVASHITESFGPVQALKSYLIKGAPNFVFVEHPFSYSSVSASSISLYRGSLLSDKNINKQFSIELFSYLRDIYLTLLWFLKAGKDTSLFIGVDNLNAFVGVLLKKLGFTFKLVYYSVDYSPNRFENILLNKLYNFVDRLVVKYSDYVWNSSKRINDLRSEQNISPLQSFIVPNGVYLDAVKLLPERNKNILVISEHLTNDKGVQLLIKSFSEILKLNKKAKLIIYGSGPYEQKLKKQVTKNSIEKHVIFKGPVSPEIYLEELSKYGIGLCLRKGDKLSTAYYSDPISVKEFLASGLPVITTNNLWISSEVDSLKLGKSISYNKKELINALKELWTNENFYNKCKSNSLEYVKKLSWNKIFNKAFSKIEL